MAETVANAKTLLAQITDDLAAPAKPDSAARSQAGLTRQR
jgi:hypothetical protein